MKHLALILFLASALSAQIFYPPGSVRRYAGTPTSGDCTASAVGRRAVDYSAIPSVHYKCSQTSSGVYEWEEESAGGGGSGDITSVTAGSGLTGGGTSGGVTLSLATVTASRALASDSSGYPAATSVTATELGYLSGVSGALQTQLDGKVGGAASLPTAGAIPYVGSSGTLTETGNLFRGSNLIEQRNSTNAQTFRLYNTYTDASNYRRLTIDNAAGVSRIYTSHAGTGTAYPLDLGVSNAVQWRIDTDGAIRPITDNTYDFGNSSGKVRDIYAARDIIGSSTSCIYLGAAGTDGSWRFCRSSNDLVVSRRESGSWVAKGTWAP